MVSLTGGAHAQWVRESYPLVSGWNAVWVPVDVSHQSADALPGAVEEIWMWNPAASGAHFTEVPSPSEDVEWLVWKRGAPQESTIDRLVPNAAYLIKIADGTGAFTLHLTGKPLPPRYRWKSSGLNFLGFPMRPEISTNVRNFNSFLSYESAFADGPEVFKYAGGPLSSNPIAVNTLQSEPVRRGSAYWIRGSRFSEYYGPLRVNISSAGLDFSDTITTITLGIRNVTDESVVATLTPTLSFPPPSGEPVNAGRVPLKIRDRLEPGSIQSSYSSLTEATDFTIPAKSEIKLVVAVDRQAMTGNPGDVFQSIVQVTDSENMSRIDLPVRAVVTNLTGLWVGSATLTSVDQVTAAPNVLGDGTATVAVSRQPDASVPAEFPIRLIMSRASNGRIKLLQRVHVGESATGVTIVVKDQSSLNQSKLATAQRLSSASFPPGLEVVATGGTFGQGTISFDVPLSYTAPTNPFVHTYHPDHDNKDSQFSASLLPEGEESFSVTRNINLTFVADPAEISLSEPGWGSVVVGGSYEETFTGLRAQSITAKGTFILRRISPQALTVPRSRR